MRNAVFRIAAIATVSVAGITCGPITEPLKTDVDIAHEQWLANHPETYTFEVATVTSINTNTGFYRIQVSNGQVVAAVDPEGKPVPDVTFTLDNLWDYVLAAHQKAELNRAVFNEHGVPLEVDFGTWSNDSGVHYSIRNFAESQ